jgi:predicted O-linked N-acetylglucosamine transferase (SPINDLY family)
MPDPRFADPRFQEAFRNLEQAVNYQNRGLFDQAEKKYSQVVKRNPEYFDALHFFGLFKFQQGSLDEALKLVTKATKINPRSANACNSRGMILADLGRHEDALASFDAALKLEPNHVRALGNRGNVLNELGHYEAAVNSADRALAIDRDYSEAYIPRGAALLRCGRVKEALESYERAIRLNPNFAMAWVGRGNVFHHSGDYDQALAAYDKAVALKPDLFEAWLGRGRALAQGNRPHEALAAFDRALGLKAASAEAWLGRSLALFDSNRVTEALTAIDKSLAIRPDYSDAISHRIFVLDFLSEAGFEEQQQARKYWWQKIGSVVASQSRLHHSNSRDPDRRIKLGYVSGDFRRHSVGLSTKPVLQNHDRTQFEITCYSTSSVEDELTMDFRQTADRWRDVARSSDDAFCAQVQADQIDILIDLSGHTAGNRLTVFARKPTPVQVAAWGHATGSGLPTIDYLFSDPIVCPPAVRHLFAEKIFDLPCVMPPVDFSDRLPASTPPVLSKGKVTFGVFNRASKNSDGAVSLWARILHAVPRSQILMKHFAFDEASMRRRFSEIFAAHGIDAEQVAFLGTTSRRDHLAAFKEVDISLDPFPQNGGTSTVESLQVGVPVVAKLGNTIASRLAGAILTSVGMADWVADSEDEYLALAVKFASRPDQLSALRQDLPTRIAMSAVGNSAVYTKAIEAAYRTMWADYCRAAPQTN